MKIFKKLREFKKRFSRHQALVEVLVSKRNLLHNLCEYKRAFPKLQFAPVLKSNAYGHGLLEVAEILDSQNCPFFMVDSIYEALALKQDGIKTKILVAGYTHPENLKNAVTKNVSYTITSLAELQEISKLLKSKKNFHLKIDTGMHRQGILPEEIRNAVEIIKSCKFINLEGLLSHLADADGRDLKFTESQTSEWQRVIKIFQNEFQEIKFFHLANSAGAFFSNGIFANVARLGGGLYGIDAAPNSKHLELDLKPALEIRSCVSSIRSVEANEFIGYNLTYRTLKKMKLATVPLGYFEGVDRRLSNIGKFKINENFCEIAGRVSMNITSIDVTNLPKVQMGDPVTIISRKKDDPNSVENIARQINTDPREILVHIAQHLRRVVVD